MEAGKQKILPALKKKEKGNGKDAALHPKGMQVRADQVIPMGEKDFKGFLTRTSVFHLVI
jgi:hypothetical protein